MILAGLRGQLGEDGRNQTGRRETMRKQTQKSEGEMKDRCRHITEEQTDMIER